MARRAPAHRGLIARGIFISTADLRRKLVEYIRLHAKPVNPFAGRTTIPRIGPAQAELVLQPTRWAARERRRQCPIAALQDCSTPRARIARRSPPGRPPTAARPFPHAGFLSR